MAEGHSEPNYMPIFYWLFGLTVAELAVAYMGLPKPLMVGALVGLSLCITCLRCECAGFLNGLKIVVKVNHNCSLGHCELFVGEAISQITEDCFGQKTLPSQ